MSTKKTKLSSRFMPTWNPSSGIQVTGLIHLIQHVYEKSGCNKNQVWCEIGSNIGESALLISSFQFVSKLYCIDPLWSPEQELAFKDRLSHLNEKIQLIRKKSSDIFDLIENNSLDCIYIDGDHSYDMVVHDLSFALAKVRSTGFICGHDYGPAHAEVIRAVDEFKEKNKLYLTKFCDSSFVLSKFTTV